MGLSIFSFFKKCSLYFHTLKFVYPFQIYKRIYALIQKKCIPYFPPHLKDEYFQNIGLSPQTHFLNHDAWNCTEKILHGKFCFLNDNADLGSPICWQVPNKPMLWQFYLHYFHYLYLLNPEQQETLCLGWIKANPIGSLGWHSYPLSLRIVNWCKANLQNKECLQSLFQQANFLFHHLETYHPGNHLLENAKALIFAGQFFSNSSYGKKWQAKGIQIFRQETPNQVLADGGYFERSPMYHALMLEAYLDLVNILSKENPKLAHDLKKTASQMTAFLEATTHPNGMLALFNDSTHEVAPQTSKILKYASLLVGASPSKDCFPKTGFWTYRTDDFYFIIKAGLIAPNHLPAHAHADLFSYELSIAGDPIVVDAGVFEYQAGKMRDYVRSTKAHNTFCVNQQDQAECWASFRIARRYPPKNVTWKSDLNGFEFSGEFLGYSQLLGKKIKCHRKIDCSILNRHFIVTDTFTGTGEFLLESMIHFDHRLKINTRHDNNISIEGEHAKLHFSTTKGLLTQETTWRCPQFGLKHESIAFVVSAQQQIPVSLQYKLNF